MFTLIVHGADRTYEVLIDGERKEGGSIEADWVSWLVLVTAPSLTPPLSRSTAVGVAIVGFVLVQLCSPFASSRVYVLCLLFLSPILACV